MDHDTALLPVELAMGLVNRIIQSFEVTHEPNLTITEQLIAVSIHDGCDPHVLTLDS